MTFLTSRRERPRDLVEDSSNRPSDKKRRRKSTKSADTEAEISRYFMSAKPTNLGVTTSHGERYQQDMRRSRDHESPQPFANFADRPFLGFGSCGPNTSIPPAKIPVNTDSRSPRRGDSQSPTPATSYPTRSQSGQPSCASSLPERRHEFEPLISSKLSNCNRTSPAPRKGQKSIPPVSPPCVQIISSRTEGTSPRPFSKHETANEAPSQDRESGLAIDKRPTSRDKNENHRDNGTTELEAAKISQDIKNSILDNTHPVIAATHDGPESAPPHQYQAVCQSSGYEPRCEPQAHDVRRPPAQTPIIVSHKDPLDDILDRLLRDSHTSAAGSDPVSRAISRDFNVPVSEEARLPNTTQVHSPVHPRAFVDSLYSPEAPSSTSNFSRKPRSAILRRASAHDKSSSTHTLSRGSLQSSNRLALGCTQPYPPIATQSQVGSSSAWNGYADLCERQEEQADLAPETSREHKPFYPGDLSDPSRESDHAAAPDKYARVLHSMKLGDEFNGHRPYLYRMLQEGAGNINGNYQEIRPGEWNDDFGDHEASYNPGAPFSNEAQEDCDIGNVAEDYVDDYQQREINADHEHSFKQEADQNETKYQLFTTNMPDTCSSWWPHHNFSRKYVLERCAVDAQDHEFDPALSGFWAPHKLY